ncbi:hypothetical protein L3Q82_019891 [Scortum barcoo]|uniref:Uncharacterized protein n=1 Tax=Scortum barcoo TaxID=214431 RepID=A0ACB8VCW7_9TELE|nr:hypothetical protein L3Q82_019891 [Scortum barcoo]
MVDMSLQCRMKELKSQPGGGGCPFGDLRIVSLLFSDYVVLLPSSDCDLQHAPGGLQPSEAVGIKVRTSRFEALVSCKKKVDCSLWVGSELLLQEKEFKYLSVLFRSESKMECKIDTQTGPASALLQTLYWTIVVKRDFSRKAKLFIYRLISFLTLTHGHEL